MTLEHTYSMVQGPCAMKGVCKSFTAAIVKSTCRFSAELEFFVFQCMIHVLGEDKPLFADGFHTFGIDKGAIFQLIHLKTKSQSFYKCSFLMCAVHVFLIIIVLANALHPAEVPCIVDPTLSMTLSLPLAECSSFSQ